MTCFTWGMKSLCSSKRSFLLASRCNTSSFCSITFSKASCMVSVETSILRLKRFRACSTPATCLVARSSMRKLKPSTNSSIVSSPESSTSKLSHVVERSRTLRSTPWASISTTIAGRDIKWMNSGLSRRPLSSASARRNSEHSKVVKAWRLTSAMSCSSCFLPEASAMKHSEATAVSKLSIVQDMNVTKMMKNSRQPVLISTTGDAIVDQSSIVVTWKRVKSEVGMSRKRSCT
mmetsp:Transcript_49461/g.140285  ORF Transcript_49461/g.140285 Transcript_49461/m.140285 type:complete len:233 (+) Transcript_49461:353-1051(+)